MTDRDSLLNAIYDFGGAWAPIYRPGQNIAFLTWWLRGGRPVFAERDADLSRDIGSILDINASTERE